MDRRGFLRGTLLTAPAIVLGPGIVELVGRETADVAILDDVVDEAPATKPIMQILDQRQRAHATFFGEIPRVLWVNPKEYRDYFMELGSATRYMDTGAGLSGLDHLLFRNTIIASADRDVLFVNYGGES